MSDRVKLKARLEFGCVTFKTGNYTWIADYCPHGFQKKCPQLYKKLEAAEGKHVNVEVTIK